MLRHVAWFNEAPVEPRPEGGLTSPEQAVCRRCLAPARELERLGLECSVFGNLHDADPLHVSQHLQKLNTDIVVIGRISGPSLLKLARAAKHLGCYVVADIGSMTYAEEDLSQLIQLADQTVAATTAIAAFLRERTGTNAVVIPDCEDQNGSLQDVAHQWLECFKKLKMKPAAGANTNVPRAN